MDDVIRALCKIVNEYHELHSQCWGASPAECKELMTMKFPVIQGFSMQNIIRDIGALPYDNSNVGEYLKEYKTAHNSDKTICKELLQIINNGEAIKASPAVTLFVIKEKLEKHIV